MIKKYIPKIKIQSKVRQLAKKIYKNHKQDKEINLITVLTGAKFFAKDLKKELRKLGLKVNEQYIKVKSYSGTKTTGKITVVKDLKKSIANKKVMIIEDILDTGLTLDFLTKYLKQKKKAKSIEICAFLSKPSRRLKNIKANYIGFNIADKFVIGYGLDYNGRYRKLEYIGVYIENKK